MKNSELMAAVNSGRIVCVGEYWSGVCETITTRDKNSKTGGSREFHIARETILTEKEPIVITRFLRDDEPHDKWAPSAKKRQKVVVFIQGMEIERGTVRLNGTVEALTEA